MWKYIPYLKLEKFWLLYILYSNCKDHFAFFFFFTQLSIIIIGQSSARTFHSALQLLRYVFKWYCVRVFRTLIGSERVADPRSHEVRFKPGYGRCRRKSHGGGGVPPRSRDAISREQILLWLRRLLLSYSCRTGERK